MGRGFGSLKNKWREELFEAQQGLCWWCKTKMSLNRRKNGQPARDFATFEHLKRAIDGGKVNSDNIRLAHYKCNRKREGIKNPN